MVSHVVCISFGCVFSTSYNFAIAINYEYLLSHHITLVTCTDAHYPLRGPTERAEPIKVGTFTIGLNQICSKICPKLGMRRFCRKKYWSD